MAQSITDEEIQLKKRARRRLVGAIALVLIVVIFLPMVLDNEPKPVSQDIAIHIPSRDGTDFSSNTVPTQDKPALEAPPPSVEVQAPVAEPEPVAPSKHLAPPVKAVEAKPTPKPVQKAEAKSPKAEVVHKPEPVHKAEPVHKSEPVHKAESSTKASSGFVVQLGAFSNLDNAKQRQSKLSSIGVKFYTETLKTPTGAKLRVRAGPFATRQDAEKLQEKLKAAGIQDGIIAEMKE
ncbi:SPOR domain-containing protein [Sulfurirhabdus autotrophica]|uniref:DedD protein n=1 Tax=Sulfurirhabdus autotrophica TaxID=1706046 RepID=A0A4V2W340_9PROT|nr:SPOR domain-containing protein [Sulfurirhabdus autotrophica]TCV90469.1 DedD protein [Sulfurirhabdus autotrophica]